MSHVEACRFIAKLVSDSESEVERLVANDFSKWSVESLCKLLSWCADASRADVEKLANDLSQLDATLAERLAERKEARKNAELFFRLAKSEVKQANRKGTHRKANAERLRRARMWLRDAVHYRQMARSIEL